MAVSVWGHGNEGELSIRRIEASDSLEELTDLLHRAYATLGARGFNYTAVDQSVAATREQIGKKECYLGLVAGRMIATLLLGPGQPRQLACEWYGRPGVWIIGRFAVDPALQRKGIGGRMLTFAEQRARSQGALETAVDTAEGAEHLIELYTKRGYRRVGHVQWEGKSYRSVVLSKTLALDH
jgi:GNAT superfamily N-acetyltransferase